MQTAAVGDEANIRGVAFNPKLTRIDQQMSVARVDIICQDGQVYHVRRRYSVRSCPSCDMLSAATSRINVQPSRAGRELHNPQHWYQIPCTHPRRSGPGSTFRSAFHVILLPLHSMLLHDSCKFQT